jgi:putative transposase
MSIAVRPFLGFSLSTIECPHVYIWPMLKSIKKNTSKRNSLEAISKRKLPGIRHGRHCVFMLHVHLVFVSKYRKKVFTKEVLNAMESIFKKVCMDFNADLKEFNGEFDHVHLLINYPPKVALSKLVNSLKGVSARLLRKEQFPQIRQLLWGESLWSPSYFAGSCGGAPLEVIRQYIKAQQAPHF